MGKPWDFCIKLVFCIYQCGIQEVELTAIVAKYKVAKDCSEIRGGHDSTLLLCMYLYIHI